MAGLDRGDLRAGQTRTVDFRLSQEAIAIDAQLAYQPNDLVRFDLAGSVGDWTYLDDVTGTYKPDNRDAATQTFEFYIQDAVDNSRFNGFAGDHDADEAEVYFGYARKLNIGFQISF